MALDLANARLKDFPAQQLVSETLLTALDVGDILMDLIQDSSPAQRASKIQKYLELVKEKGGTTSGLLLRQMLELTEPYLQKPLCFETSTARL